MIAVPDALLVLIDDVLADVDVAANPYFVALADGSLSHADFLATQMQFHAAVVEFHRPMAALGARIDDAVLRALVFRNVHEELGEGDAGRAHGATFVTFLSRVAREPESATLSRLAALTLRPPLRSFNVALWGACTSGAVVVGAAVLGIIEQMFADISMRIGRGSVQRGFISEGEMIHYNLHERLDVRHAADFFRIAAVGFDVDDSARRAVLDGLRLGAFLFDRLYRDLFAMAKR